MVSIDVLRITAWISLALGALITAALIFRKENRIAISFLIAWTILRVYRQFLLVWVQDAHTSYTTLLYRTGFPTHLLCIPLIYLFVRAFTEEDFSWKKVSWLHFLPFAGGIGWFVWIYHSADALTSSAPYTYEETHRWNIVVNILLCFYTVLVIRKVRWFERSLKSTHSNLGIYRSPLLKLVIASCFLALAFGIADLVTGPEIPFWSGAVGLSALMLFMTAALIMRQTEVFHVPVTPEPTIVLSDDEVLRLKNNLDKVLHEQKLYLDPHLRLKDLADKMGLKSYRLTALLRQGLNTTFYDHINKMRIEHAKQLLLERNQKMNILGIATESGFNSKSAFNELFKKYNRATPSQFRKNVVPE